MHPYAPIHSHTHLVARRGAAWLRPLWAHKMAAGAHMRAGRQVWGLNELHECRMVVHAACTKGWPIW